MSILEAIVNDEIDFTAAMLEADEVPAAAGLDLAMVKKEDIQHLVGLPFMIVGGTFREGLDRAKKKTDFLTVAAIIASEDVLSKKRISMDGKPFGPLWLIGFNDGSTGVRRQMVKYLNDKGIIQVNHASEELVEVGARGECSYDKLVGEWVHHHEGEITSRDKDGNTFYTWNFELKNGLMCPRGLRTSSYGGKSGDENTTKYLA